MSVSSRFTNITAAVLLVLSAVMVLFLFFGAKDDGSFSLRFLGNPVKLRFYGELKSKDLKLSRDDIHGLEKKISTFEDAMKGVDVRVTKINSYDTMKDSTRIMVSMKVRTPDRTIYTPAPEIMLRRDLVEKLAKMIADQAEDVRAMAADGRYRDRNVEKVVSE